MTFICVCLFYVCLCSYPFMRVRVSATPLGVVKKRKRHNTHPVTVSVSTDTQWLSTGSHVFTPPQPLTSSTRLGKTCVMTMAIHPKKSHAGFSNGDNIDYPMRSAVVTPHHSISSRGFTPQPSTNSVHSKTATTSTFFANLSNGDNIHRVAAPTSASLPDSYNRRLDLHPPTATTCQTSPLQPTIHPPTTTTCQTTPKQPTLHPPHTTSSRTNPQQPKSPPKIQN